MKLSDIKKLCDEATPGPWAPCTAFVEDEHGGCYQLILTGDEKHPTTRIDRKFIAASRTVIPKLLAVAEAAKHAVDNGLWIEEQNIVVPELDGSSRKRIIKALEALESE